MVSHNSELDNHVIADGTKTLEPQQVCISLNVGQFSLWGLVDEGKGLRKVAEDLLGILVKGLQGA